MNYKDTINWMFQQLPMYQNKGAKAFKKDLSNSLKLAKHLGQPHQQFKSIHVGGTNGKGSTSHMLASILQEAGYKVGLYTSPHLKDFRERIKINGKPITKQYVIGFIKRNKSFFETNQLSFFEMTVGMAFDFFAKKQVNIAIIEVGLGGRLDSTNIITPILSVITNIGYDHMDMLGNTLALIAAEKAGIIKTNVPVVIGETHSETKQVFIEKAKSTVSDIYFADQLINTIYESDLKGSYQKQNIKTATKAIEVLKENASFNISKQQMQSGFLNVVTSTGLLGRWQVLGNNPKIICDTAHNKEGLTQTMQQLQNEIYDNLHIVFGVVADKNLDDIIPLLPKNATYYLCKPMINRGLSVTILADKMKAYNLDYTQYELVKNAILAAKQKAKLKDVIYIGGSTFVVAEVL